MADEDLIASVAEDRSSEALATLYDRHSRAAYSSYRMMGEKQAAEDPVQDTFL
jgi:RNA polymerase sigma-70 factor, ECF subfamily